MRQQLTWTTLVGPRTSVDELLAADRRHGLVDLPDLEESHVRPRHKIDLADELMFIQIMDECVYLLALRNADDNLDAGDDDNDDDDVSFKSQYLPHSI